MAAKTTQTHADVNTDKPTHGTRVLYRIEVKKQNGWEPAEGVPPLDTEIEAYRLVHERFRPEFYSYFMGGTEKVCIVKESQVKP
jgi:hypothetical protein